MKEKNNMKKKAGKRFFKRLFHRKIVLFGTALVVLFVLLALAAPLVSPYDPYAVDPVHMWEKPSAEHWLGTDNVGRDCLLYTSNRTDGRDKGGPVSDCGIGMVALQKVLQPFPVKGKIPGIRRCLS